MGASFVGGAMVGLWNYIIIEKAPVLTRLITLSSSLSVAFVTRIFVEYIPNCCYSVITFSSIVWLVPGMNMTSSPFFFSSWHALTFIYPLGLSLTIAMAELTTKNMISGTARLLYALITALQLGFGIAIGNIIPVLSYLKQRMHFL